MLHSIGFVLLSISATAVLYFLWRKTPNAPALLEDRVVGSLNHRGFMVAVVCALLAAAIYVSEFGRPTAQWIMSFLPATDAYLEGALASILSPFGTFGCLAAIFATALLTAIVDDHVRPALRFGAGDHGQA